MLKKSYTKTGKSCKVTFYLSPETGASHVSLCGEFNNWDPSAHPMKTRKDGTFYTTINLDAGRSYRYRFLLDNKRWENDWEAESYIPNEHGSDDSLVTV